MRTIEQCGEIFNFGDALLNNLKGLFGVEVLKEPAGFQKLNQVAVERCNQIVKNVSVFFLLFKGCVLAVFDCRLKLKEAFLHES